jgi:hypothetical protein
MFSDLFFFRFVCLFVCFLIFFVASSCVHILLGSALSNASALWSVIIVLISVSLRRTFPGGVKVTGHGSHYTDQPQTSPVEEGGSGRSSGSGGGSSGVLLPNNKVSPVEDFGTNLGGDSAGADGAAVDSSATPNAGDAADSGAISPDTSVKAHEIIRGESGSKGDLGTAGSSRDSGNDSPDRRDSKSKSKSENQESEHDGCCVMFLEECIC